jgi:thiamine biosynthesis lipoprotein
VSRGALLLVGLLGTARVHTAAAVTEVHYVMGTYFRITAEGQDEGDTRSALRRCFTTARAFDARFSRFEVHGELSQLNAHADDATTATVSPEMAALLDAALQLAGATNGAFDVSAGSLTRLWRTAAEWPSPQAITQAREAAGRGVLALAGTTLHRRPGVLIDLDGIAKGWAIDRCVAQLREDGVERAFLSFGESSLYALGGPAATTGWEVLLRDLTGKRALGTLTLRDEAVSVSSVYGHERRIGARRVGHIVDPRSGLPLRAPALAVVVAPSATVAEAFSKALLVDGRVRLRSPHARGVSGALLVRPTGVQRFGRLAFAPFNGAPIPAAAEPLR